MSRPNSYLPDPKGWIETASSIRPRKSSQRPLTSFAHGLATPPTSSSFKRTSNATAGPGPASTVSAAARKRKSFLENETPLPLNRQSSLSGFFTPPTTGGLESKGKGKGQDRASQVKEQQGVTPLSQKAGSQGRGMLGFRRAEAHEGIRGSRLKVHKDTEDFWGSDEHLPDEPATPPRVASKSRTRTRSPESSPPLFDKPAHNSSPSRPAEPPSSDRPITPVPDYVLDIHRRLCGQGSENKRRVNSPRKRAPLPQPIGDAQSRTSISPEAKTRKRDKPTTREEVDRRVWEKAHQERHKTPDGKAKLLVDLSSSSNPPSDDVERRVWSIVHGKSAEKGKALVKLSSSDPPSEEAQSPTTKKGKGRAGPLSPLSTNRLPKRNPSINQQMLQQASPVARAVTPSRKKLERMISPLPRTSVRPRSPILLPPLASPHSTSVPARAKAQSPSPAPASLDDRITHIIDRARENEAKLEDDLLSMCDPATSQAYSQRHRTRSQKQRVSTIADASTPPTQHPTSPEQLLVTPRKRSPFLHAHHKLTPPKSGSKSLLNSPTHRPSQLAMVSRQQTLFVLPEPPRQPDFSPRISSGAIKRPGWKPVEMDPETLVSWSMGNGGNTSESYHSPSKDDAETRTAAQDDGAVKNIEREGSLESQDAPLFGDEDRESLPNTPPRRPSIVERSSSSKSIEQTFFSQNFPVLVPTSPLTSPVGNSGRSREHLGQDQEDQVTTKSDLRPSAATAAAFVSTSQVSAPSNWGHLARGVLAGSSTQSAIQKTHITPKSAAGSTSQSKKRKLSTSDRRGQPSQGKLAAFGFFGDAKGKEKERKHDFNQRWEDEADLEFDADLDGGVQDHQGEGNAEGISDHARGLHGEKRMGKVPEAPHHPHLRPAGIRELERRATQSTFQQRAAPRTSNKAQEANPFLEDKEEEEDLPLFDHDQRHEPHLSSDRDDYSSAAGSSQLASLTSTTDGDGAKTPKEVRDWWDALGERRTSEFGTLE